MKPPPPHSRRPAGALTIELVVAAAMLLTVFLPLGLGLVTQHRQARDLHLRAVIMQHLDGELEVLSAGGWRQLPAEGRRWELAPQPGALVPRGHFEAVAADGWLRVSWQPAPGQRGRTLQRETRLPEAAVPAR